MNKLTKEVARADNSLRRFVGYAKLLKILTLELVTAEQEEKSWLNEAIESAAEASEKD